MVNRLEYSVQFIELDLFLLIPILVIIDLRLFLKMTPSGTILDNVKVNQWRKPIMINPKKLEEVAKQLSDNLPNGLKQFAGDFEEKSKQILQNQLMKLDVVSHEEFEVQQHVLLKTREKLEALQVQIDALEKKLS